MIYAVACWNSCLLLYVTLILGAYFRSNQQCFTFLYLLVCHLKGLEIFSITIQRFSTKEELNLPIQTMLGTTCRCGPCKVMLPYLVKLQEANPDIKIYKLNCNKKNKELGMKLNVKVAPTFQLYKNSKKVSYRVVTC